METNQVRSFDVYIGRQRTRKLDTNVAANLGSHERNNLRDEKS